MDEIKIRHKDKLGGGTEHNVYNFEKFKDKVIKTRHGDFELGSDGTFKRVSKFTLNQNEMKTFQDNPDLFARVYKLTDRYAIIEKLDTKTIKQDLHNKVAGAIVKTFIMKPDLMDGWSNKKPTDLTSQDFDGAGMLNAFRNHKEFIKGVLTYTPDRDFVIKLLQLINKAYNTLKKHTVDIHEENIGYDKEGNIKLLDF